MQELLLGKLQLYLAVTPGFHSIRFDQITYNIRPIFCKPDLHVQSITMAGRSGVWQYMERVSKLCSEMPGLYHRVKYS